jgi:hypothetical protein
VNTSSFAGKIKNALHVHAEWRIRIKRAITSGTFDKTPEQLLDDTDCDIGKWLYYEVPEPLKGPEYHTLRVAHRRFHQVISEIIRNVLEGETYAATEQIRAGSEFMELSALMNRELTKWLAKI